MSERTLDVRGKACPQPVVETRHALLQEPGQPLLVILDNQASAENVTRLARSLGAAVATASSAGNDIHLLITPAAAAEPEAVNPPAGQRNVVLIGSQLLGSGAEELGMILMRAFIKTLQEVTPLPHAILFVNSGVFLTTDGSDLLDDIRLLADRGVQIFSCGTCLDYYDRKETLRVGKVTNMFETLTMLTTADRVIRP